MSVLVLDDNGYRPSDRYDQNILSKKQKYIESSDARDSEGIGKANLPDDTDLENSLAGEVVERPRIILNIGKKLAERDKLSSESCRVLDNSVEIIEPDEDLLRTPDKGGKRKRSSSESSESDVSPFNSPEIPFAGTPVIYKLCELNNTKIIIKKSIAEQKPQTPRMPKKISQKEIDSLLNSDDDEDIIERKKKLPAEAEPMPTGTPKRPIRNAARITEANTPRSSPRIRRAAAETPKQEERSLRMKFRRSTDQSNYKVELDVDSRERRASLRTTIILPKKYDDMEMDEPLRGTPSKSAKNDEGTPRASQARKTPSRSVKILHSYEEPSDFDNTPETPKRSRQRLKKDDTDEDAIFTPSRTRSKASSVLKSVPTTPSGRPRRSTRLTSQNIELSDEEGNENDTNRQNKSDDSDGEPLPKILIDRKKSAMKTMTPKKSVTIASDTQTPKKSVTIVDDVKTPRKTPRRNLLAETTPKRSSKLVDEPVTPRSRGRVSKVATPSMRHGNLTPSMHQRAANVGKPKTALQEARAQLHVSAVPKSLPCREEEFNDIFTFLQRKLVDHSSGCIYISGVPGTGKTATVNEVVRCLKKLVTKGDLDEFQYLEINGMKLTEPRQAYVQILKQINGQSLTWEQAYQSLEKRFTKSTGSRPMTLLLVDELDLLCNKRQDVVYNLLDWPAKQNAQLVVMTIANTMDLPERVLMGRVTSRLGLTRLTFQPYNHKQLQEIVTTRLKDSDAFRSEAIQLVARKVAAVSGDARRALDICRRATEIAESNGNKSVSMQDVNEALTEMIASAKVQAIKHCSEMEKVFLQAVCAEISRTGVEETSFQSVFKQFEALCSFEGVKTPNVSQTLDICGRLSANRLLLCEHSRSDIMQRILLNVSADDIHFALQSIKV